PTIPRARLPPSRPLPTLLYPLSLHDALPIFPIDAVQVVHVEIVSENAECIGVDLVPLLARFNLHRQVGQLNLVRSPLLARLVLRDRKSTRLNSSHVKIAYAVFCSKKKTPIRE